MARLAEKFICSDCWKAPNAEPVIRNKIKFNDIINRCIYDNANGKKDLFAVSKNVAYLATRRLWKLYAKTLKFKSFMQIFGTDLSIVQRLQSYDFF